jgi:methionine-rich copper-binding protein CopC
MGQISVRLDAILARSLSPAAFAAFVAVVSATAAQAQAYLDHAIPADNSTLHVPPTQIELSFSETIEPASSTVEVLDQAGRHAEQGKPELEPDNAKVLRIKIKLAGPGTYKVIWHVLSVETRWSGGRFTFTFAP